MAGSGKDFRTFILEKASIFSWEPRIIPNSEDEEESIRANALEDRRKALQEQLVELQEQVSNQAQSDNLPANRELVNLAGQKIRQMTEGTASKDARQLVIQAMCEDLDLPAWIANPELLRAASQAIGKGPTEEVVAEGIVLSKEEKKVVGRYMQSYRERYTAKDLLECLISAHGQKLQAGLAIARSREASKDPSQNKDVSFVTTDTGFVSTLKSFAEAKKFDSFKPALLKLIASTEPVEFDSEMEADIAVLVTAICDPQQSALTDRILTTPRRNAFTTFDLMYGPSTKTTDPDAMEANDGLPDEHPFWRLLQIYQHSCESKEGQVVIQVRESISFVNSHFHRFGPAGVAICYALLRDYLMQTLARGQLVDAAEIAALFGSITLQYANNDLQRILESSAVVEGFAGSATHPLAQVIVKRLRLVLNEAQALLSTDVVSPPGKNVSIRDSDSDEATADVRRRLMQPLDDMLASMQLDDENGVSFVQDTEHDRIITIVRAAEGDTAFYVLIRRLTTGQQNLGGGYEMALPMLSIHKTDKLDIIHRPSGKPHIMFRFTAGSSHRPLPLRSDLTKPPLDAFLTKFYLDDIRRARLASWKENVKATG